MSEERVLVAGVGDVFRGDDGFGAYAVRELTERGYPQQVRVTDFGVKSEDLASEIQNGYEAVILLEAVANGGTPGTLYVFDPEVDPVEAGQAIFSSQGLAPEDALKVLDAFDGYDGQILIVGCEPQSFEQVDALNDPVEAALPDAMSLLDSLLARLLGRDGEILGADSGGSPATPMVAARPAAA